MRRGEEGKGGVVFLVDVDRTILHTDLARLVQVVRLRKMLGRATNELFREIYDSLKRESGVVDVLGALERFQEKARLKEPTLARVKGIFTEFNYRRYLYKGAQEVVAHLTRLGRVYFFTEGHPLIQWRKIRSSGLDGHGVLAFRIAKESHIDRVAGVCPADHYLYR